MALIKYSALVSGMSGKLNGSVAARNKGGNYLRNKTTPVNPQTTAQSRARSVFGGVSTAFRQLGDYNVAAWNAAAENFPYTNIFGDVSYLNGLQLFTKLNTNLTVVGSPTLTAPPTPKGSGSITDVASGILVGAGEFNIEYTSRAEGISVRFIIECTGPVAGNSRFYKNRFRQIAAGDSTVLSDSEALYDAYVLRFGVPLPNSNIAIRLTQVNITTGERSVAVVGRTAVSA